jgi:hypothetical protein
VQKGCKKLLGKINYLRRFISNLAGRVESLLSLVRLKHEEEFTGGGRTVRSFREGQRIPHVSTCVASSEGWEPVQDVYCWARMGYWSYSTTRSRCLLDAETRYVFVEKLCLTLYYACSKFRHYILSSSCIVACQYDVIKHMLLKPILSGRMGKWAYALVEYHLAYEPLRSMKGQVVADFIFDHAIDVDYSINFVQLKPWGLYFDGSVCSKGQGAGCVVVSPSGV